MYTRLGDVPVGSIVILNENSAPVNFIVVHQGKPSDAYDSSCDGTWLLRQNTYSSEKFDSSDHDYAKSDIHSRINGTFVNRLDSDIQSSIKEVKLPYRAGIGSSTNVTSGASGLAAKVFLLSYTEVGFSGSDYAPVEGAVLSYFDGADDSKRIAKNDSGYGSNWWLRSPYTQNTKYAWQVRSTGEVDYTAVASTYGARLALVLLSTLWVSDSGAVVENAPPTITSPSGSSGVNLGTKNAGFDLSYTVADGDMLTVIEKMDDLTVRTFTSAPDSVCEFQITNNTIAPFENGSEHTLTVEVSDGVGTSVFTATFTKLATETTITLATPIAADAPITRAVLTITGNYPHPMEESDWQVLVTNNASDPNPVWEDATGSVMGCYNHLFTNTTAQNGPAFNFKITVARGDSGVGGYITAVGGAFE